MSKSKVVVGLAVFLMVAGPAPAQEKPITRIAVINIGEVLTKSDKLKEAKKTLEATTNQFRKQAENLKDEMKKWQALVFDPKADPDEKIVANKHLLAVRRKMEDLDNEARRQLGKSQEQVLADVWAEVQTAIKNHADANDIDLVLIYGDPPKDDVMKFANLNRKIQAVDGGAIVPIFIRNRIDITQTILHNLNQGYATKTTNPDDDE